MVGMLGYPGSRTNRRAGRSSKEVPDGTLRVVGQALDAGVLIPGLRCERSGVHHVGIDHGREPARVSAWCSDRGAGDSGGPRWRGDDRTLHPVCPHGGVERGTTGDRGVARDERGPGHPAEREPNTEEATGGRRGGRRLSTVPSPGHHNRLTPIPDRCGTALALETEDADRRRSTESARHGSGRPSPPAHPVELSARRELSVSLPELVERVEVQRTHCHEAAARVHDALSPGRDHRDVPPRQPHQ